jgi:transcriptional regulator with XRE-family HTH domain
MLGRKELGQRFRAARYLAGLDQQAVGEALGLDQSSVSNIETGRTAVTVEQLLAIAKVTNTSLLELLDSHEGRAPNEETLLIAYRHLTRKQARDAVLGVAEQMMRLERVLDEEKGDTQQADPAPETDSTPRRSISSVAAALSTPRPLREDALG